MAQTPLSKLASRIAKVEGKKHQASIGDIREILKTLIELEVAYIKTYNDADGSPLDLLLNTALVKAGAK